MYIAFHYSEILTHRIPSKVCCAYILAEGLATEVVSQDRLHAERPDQPTEISREPGQTGNLLWRIQLWGSHGNAQLPGKYEKLQPDSSVVPSQLEGTRGLSHTGYLIGTEFPLWRGRCTGSVAGHFCPHFVRVRGVLHRHGCIFLGRQIQSQSSHTTEKCATRCIDSITQDS